MLENNGVLEQFSEDNSNVKILNQMLLARIPEFTEIFEEITSWQDGIDTGSHIIFEDGLTNFVISNKHNIDLLAKIFCFIEELLIDETSYEYNVVLVSFIEPLYFNYDIQSLAFFMHDKTKKLALEYINKNTIWHSHSDIEKNEEV